MGCSYFKSVFHDFVFKLVETEIFFLQDIVQDIVIND